MEEGSVVASEVTKLIILASEGDESNKVFRKMVDALPVAIYTTDAQGRLTYFNAAAVALSGRTPELGTQQWCVTWKIYLPDGTPLPHDQCPMAIALRSGQATPGGEFIAERPDGTRFWFTPYPAVLRDAGGHVTGGINLLVDITARKNAEIQADEQYHAIVDTTPECVKIVAADGTLLKMNAAGLEMVGASSAEAVLGKDLYTLIAPEDLDRYRDFNERICRGEKGFLEFDIVKLDGRRRHMETHAAPLRHVDGSTVQLAITHDITERRRADRAALLLGAIVDSSDDAIISKNLNSIITSWNNSAERLFGYAANEVIGKPITILIPADRQAEEPAILSRLRRGERVEHFETIRVRKDGSLVNISLTISPIRDGHGKIVGASKIARDITERKRLSEVQERLAAIVESSDDAIISKDLNGIIRSWNHGAERIFGYKAQEIVGQHVSVITAPDRFNEIPNILDRIRRGESVDHYETKRKTKDGKILTVSLTVSPIRDGAGNVIGASKVARDVTERVAQEKALREANAALRRANADLQQFAYSASHDLQEPLRMVAAYSQLLQKKFGDSLGETAHDYIRHTVEGAARMETLLADLRTYTQVSTAEHEPTEDIDAGEVLNKALANLEVAIKESGASVSSGALPQVCMYEFQLQQLFQNLIGNAIRYRSSEPPRIHVAATREGNEWLISVQDNGIGIAPEFKEQIFGIFKRLHSSAQYPGTGMGLAICQRIVERGGGRIWVEPGPGRGSTFFFTVPIREP
jgi:PAS domain S-box-containing protein